MTVTQIKRRNDTVSQELKEEIDFLLSDNFKNILSDGGTLSKDDLNEIIKESTKYHIEFKKGDVRKAIMTLYEELFEMQLKLQSTWPVQTHNDKLDKVLSDSLDDGIIGCVDSIDEFSTLLKKFAETIPDATLDLIIFSRNNDLGENGIDTLTIRFGNTRNDIRQGKELGQKIVDGLEEIGFEVEWDGFYSSDIKIKNFVWQQRIQTEESENFQEETIISEPEMRKVH